MFRRAEVRTWFRRSAKTKVEVMEEFQLQSCVQGHHIYQKYVDSVVGGSTFCGLAASCLMLRLTLAFAFSRSFWVRVDDSHVIFLGSVGPSWEKYLYKASLSLQVQTSLRVCSTVKNYNQQNFGGDQIWQELKLVVLVPIAKPAKLNSLPNFPAIRYHMTSSHPMFELAGSHV